jgi:AcrR family transcriptional regulator
MRTEKNHVRSAPRSGRRQDGVATRRLLLETAAMVFADYGWSATTSKAICARARTPTASVNYHFGGKEALYAEVLAEAGRQLTAFDSVLRAAQASGGSKEKLRSITIDLIRFSIGISSTPGFRVLLREVLSPSRVLSAAVPKVFRVNVKLLLAVMGGALEQPPGHPTVRRALLFVLLPCSSMALIPKEIFGRSFDPVPKDVSGVTEDFVCYAMAGLEALAQAHRQK